MRVVNRKLCRTDDEFAKERIHGDRSRLTRQSVRHASGDKHCIALDFALHGDSMFHSRGNDDRRLRRNKPYRALGLAERNASDRHHELRLFVVVKFELPAGNLGAHSHCHRSRARCRYLLHGVVEASLKLKKFRHSRVFIVTAVR